MPGKVSKQREQVKAAYSRSNGKPSPSWSKKVDQMDDDQVAAIFLRLKSQNKI